MTGRETDQQDRRDMVRLAAGFDRPLDDLMTRHGERLFRYMIRLLQCDSEAADMAQEVFVRVYQNRAKFNTQRKFTTWLYAIATNLARDRIRWRTRHPQVSLNGEGYGFGRSFIESQPDEELDPSDRVQEKERVEVIRQAVAALPEKLRTALVLSEYEGLRHIEIAAILKCSAKAVEMRIYQARRRLRQELTEALMSV